MIVEAQRGDGAFLVTDGPAGAVVLPGGAVTYLPKDSIYARGGWSPAAGRPSVPKSVDRRKLAELRSKCEATVVLPARD